MQPRHISLILLILAFFPLHLEAQTLTQVTKTGSNDRDLEPMVSDDGRYLAWKRSTPGNLNAILCVKDLSSNSLTTIKSAVGIISRACLSGDGQTLFYMYNGNIWSVPATGGLSCIVLQNSTTRTITEHVFSTSHDGSRICYATWNSGRARLEVFDLKTRTAVDVTRNLTGTPTLLSGDISGDGRFVVFTARGQNRTDLWFAAADGTLIRRLHTGSTWVSPYNPRIDHHGTMCTFEVMMARTYEIFSALTGGSIVYQTTRSSGSWNRGPMISADGDRVIWFFSPTTAQQPSDVVMAYPEGSKQRQLTPFGNMGPNITPHSLHTLNGNGTVAAFSTTANHLGGNPELDYEIFLWKDALTTSGKAALGATISFHLEVPSKPNVAYAMRSALSRGNGLVIPGVGAIPLTPDPLFFLSGQARSIFRNYQGILDGSGRATAFVAIPNLKPLAGFTFFTSFITAAPSGISLFNPVKVTVQ